MVNSLNSSKIDQRIILLHVSLQNINARSEQSFECRSVQFDALHRAIRNHGGRSGPVEDECDLAKVLHPAQSANLNTLVSLIFLLVHDCFALLDNVEIVTRCALLDDYLAVGELTRLQCIGDRGSLPFVQAICVFGGEGSISLIRFD